MSLYFCRAFREIGRVCIGSLYKKDLGKFLPTKTRDLNSCPQRLEFLLTNCDNVSPASAFYSPLTCKHRILQYWSLGPTLGLWCLTLPFSWPFIETVLPRSSSLNFMTADSYSHDNWQPGRICRRIESLELGASRYGAHVTERPADSDFIRSSRTAAKSRTGCNIGATEVRILSAVLAILVRFPIFFWLF